uniref:Uncharacterized protein n=1 Tax=Manihot esculenta TaxID=3983 RepID=A0A2C9UT87_MANES
MPLISRQCRSPLNPHTRAILILSFLLSSLFFHFPLSTNYPIQCLSPFCFDPANPFSRMQFQQWQL